MISPSENHRGRPHLATTTSASETSTTQQRQSTVSTMESSIDSISTDNGQHHNSPNRILFGSCHSHHFNSTALWSVMSSRNATAFVWAGDAIYADDYEIVHGRKHVHGATPNKFPMLYQNLLQEVGYQQLTAQIANIFGTIDDHDYGYDNGDRTFPFRVESAMSFVDFLQASAPSVDFRIMKHRAMTGSGVYGVKVLDFAQSPGYELLTDAHAGLEPTLPATAPLSDRSVAIFLLDCRSNKTPWRKKQPQKHAGTTTATSLLSSMSRWLDYYQPDYQGDFLGEDQWQWLEHTLRRSTAAVNIVVQGLQVHADRFFDGNVVEEWSRFPMAQFRLYQAVLQSNVRAPILISGDVHMAELLRRDCRTVSSSPSPTFDGVTSRMLLEVTTSGMTHSWGTNTCSRTNVSWMCQNSQMQTALKAGMHVAHNNYAWTDLINLPKKSDQIFEGAQKGFQYTLDRNFAEVEFDWDQRQVIVRIFGEQLHSRPLLSTAWDMDLLSGKIPPIESGRLSKSDFERLYGQLSTHGTTTDQWYCLPYRGPATVLRKALGFFVPVGCSCFIFVGPFLLPLFLAYWLLRHKRSSLSTK